MPGLDGSGLLFKPLLRCLGREFEPRVVNYNRCRSQTRGALVNHVREALPKSGEFILVAESFSGPIAYDIGLKQIEGLKGIIFVVTFLSNPLPRLLQFRQLLPIGLYYRFQWPSRLVRGRLLGGGFSEELHQLFWQALQEAGARRLHQRLDGLAALTQPVSPLHLPAVYLQAEDDHLADRQSRDEFYRWCKNLRCYSLPGNHFLLQTAPAECAVIINRELPRLMTGQCQEI